MLPDEDYWTVTRFTGGTLNICARCGTSDTLAAWEAVTAYSLGDVVHATAGIGQYVFEVVTPGTSGGTEPTWPTVFGGTVLDGDVVWAARGAPLNLTQITVPQDAPTPDVDTTFLGWWLRILDPTNPNASQPR